MKDVQYADILKEAFLLTWKNKFLWFFGFIVFLGNVISNTDVFNGKSFEQGSGKAELGAVSFVFLGLFFVILMVVFFLLRIIATAAIIKSANDINLYRQLTIKNIFIESKKYVWRLLLLEIIVSIVIGVIIAVLLAPIIYLFTLKAKVFAILSLIGAIIIIIPLVILAFYLRKYGYFFVILADLGIRMSLEMAYATFAKNIKKSLLMGLVSIGLGIFLAASLLLVAIAIVAVFLPIGFVTFLLAVKIGANIVSAVGAFTVLIIWLAMFSWFESFLQTAWLLFFQQISFEKPKEKKVSEEVAEGEIPSPEAV